MTKLQRFESMSELLIISDSEALKNDAELLSLQLGVKIIQSTETIRPENLYLRFAADGLSLECGNRVMRCDLMQLLPRLKRSNLSGELLVKAAKIKKADRPLSAVDATAGLGEDALLLAAAGFSVKLYERNPVIAALLKDALRRASAEPELEQIVGRMQVFDEDSIAAMKALTEQPDVIFLDPMFPEKEKTALAKKKFQLLHHLELPCSDEAELLQAAISAHPKKIVIKRPLKGAFLAERKPDYTLKGKAIRYDCIIP